MEILEKLNKNLERKVERHQISVTSINSKNQSVNNLQHLASECGHK